MEGAYKTMKSLFSCRSAILGGVIAVLTAGALAGPAMASTVTYPPVDTSACYTPQLSQPFLSWGQNNWFTLAPGQTPNNFGGSGWTLSGGANIVTSSLAYGQSGSVLDLPPGSRAVSPPVCVQSDYPIAQAMTAGAQGGQVSVAVSYAGTKSATQPQPAGTIPADSSGWKLSPPIQVHPGNLAGWQLVQFTFVSQGKGNAEMYNFYVDPRMKG
jgi:hypothetical protein